MRKERIQNRTKLHSRGEECYFHSEYSVNATFNVCNLLSIEVGVVNSRLNPLKRDGMMKTYEETQQGII